MQLIPYTYCVVRYVHDPAAGEMLNVGVLICAPHAKFIGAKFDYHFERLSEAFAEFHGDHYRRVLRQIDAAVADLRSRAEGGLFEFAELPTDATRLGATLMPDQDLSFQLGQMLAGVAVEPEAELESLFERMVTSQYHRARPDKRTDEEVWSVYQKPLIEQRVKKYLMPRRFESRDYDLRFEHTFKNDNWHVLQPASMDYARPENIQTKATRILGTATALRGNRELGKLYLLLGKPQERKHLIQYDKAKNLLHKMPIDFEIIEEDAAEDFAAELASYMRKHGVIRDSE